MNTVVDMPHYIDASIQLIWWEVDELAPFMAGIGAGIVLEMMSQMMVAGMILSYVYIRQKRASLDGTLEHMCYWFGFFPLNHKFKSGLDREFVE